MNLDAFIQFRNCFAKTPGQHFDMEANLSEAADPAGDPIDLMKLHEIVDGTCEAVACLSGRVILATADSRDARIICNRPALTMCNRAE